MSFQNWSVKKALPYILIISGIIGYTCAFVLTQDKFEILKNPDFAPNCNLDPVLSCGSVMVTKQATAFGFPNPLIGLGAFPVLATIGVAMLAGARFKRWFWVGLETGLLAGMAFAYWLLYQSIYHINALCPYCLVVDVIMIISVWYTTLYVIDQKHVRLPKRKLVGKSYAWIRRHHLDLLVLWFLVLIALTLKHFWYYYGDKIF